MSFVGPSSDTLYPLDFFLGEFKGYQNLEPQRK